MAEATHDIPAPGDSTLEMQAQGAEDRSTSRFADRDKLATQISIGVIAFGFLLMFFAWFGASGQNAIQQQFPYMLSGGIPGLALVILGGGILVVRDIRRERDALETQIGRLAEVIERAVERPGAPVAAPRAASDADLVVRGRSVYHRPDCPIVSNKELELVTVGEVESEGLGPCRTCSP